MEQRRAAPESDDTPKGVQGIMLQAIRGVSVTEDGQDQIRPDVMAFLMQAAAAAQLVKLRKLEEFKIPLGSFSIGLTVSAKTHIRLTDPLISFSLINDGPNSVYFEFTTSWSEIPVPRDAAILSLETFSVDAKYPVIESIILDVVAATTAAVRIRGKTGRRMS